MALKIGPLKKVTVTDPTPFLEAASLGEAALALAKPGVEMKALLGKLIEAGLVMDALRLFAYALPKREAVWWACLCARQALADPPDEADVAILKASEAWVYRPTDKARREAMALAEKSKFDHAAHWPAAAAFWSGGSIAPEDCPKVEPAETLTGNAVVGAVLLAAVQPDGKDADRKRQLFLAQALDIAEGGDGRKVAAA